MAKKIHVKLIMQLRAAGMSQRAIARERHMSRTSVSDVFQIAVQHNLSYPLLEDKTPEEVYRIFYPDKHPEEESTSHQTTNTSTRNYPAQESP